jgi:hypothetical protein
VILASAILLSGCASTRVGHVGHVASREPLVTLIVSEDRSVVQRECHDVPAPGVTLGCQKSRPVLLPDGTAVRAVKIVRYTDALPSALAFEIDVHELCHTVATLQSIDDPCHAESHGLARSEAPPPRFFR